MWLRARWYGAGRGSFGARDPYAGDAQRPYSLMPYQYAYSNAVLWTDASGACIPENVPGLGETDCVFAGWDPRNWNWADGQAYYDGAPGSMGKLALMALFPPSAYVFGAENFTRGYIRYNAHPSFCGGATVFIDGVLLFLPVASFLRGGGGMATGGGVAVLSQAELLQVQQAVQQATQAGIGIRVLGEYVRFASDPSGKAVNSGGHKPTWLSKLQQGSDGILRPKQLLQAQDEVHAEQLAAEFTGVKRSMTMHKIPVPGTRRNTLPDLIGKDFLGEVKFFDKTRTITASGQRKDTADVARSRGIPYYIFTTEGTHIPQGLKTLVEQTGGKIVYLFEHP